MYELLWEGGRADPFLPLQEEDDSTTTTTRLRASTGTVVELIGDVAEIMDELHTDPAWSDAILGISSRTDAPSWAKELLAKFRLPQSKATLQQVLKGPWVISHEPKTRHFERISAATGVPLESILFFDNEAGNCRSVSKQGVSVAYCPDGVTREVFQRALECFPCPWAEVVGIDIK